MKQKKQIIALVVMIVLAVGIWSWQWWTPATGTSGGAAAFLQAYRPMTVANPEIRLWEVEKRRKAEYKASGADLFSYVVPPSPEEVKKTAEQQQKIIEAQQKNPPPIPDPQLPGNLKFFGYGTVPNGTPRRAFLTDGDEVYIVSEGDTLMGQYRILKINNASLEFEEVSSGRHGQKMLEDQGPAA